MHAREIQEGSPTVPESGRRGLCSSRRLASHRGSLSAIPREEKVLALHVARIVGELAEEGNGLSRHELASRVGARRWAPGQLTHALRTARQRGYIAPMGPDRYAASA
jgi:hypothetical protein